MVKSMLATIRCLDIQIVEKPLHTLFKQATKHVLKRLTKA